MEILLVRHAEAESELVDPMQPLRERGWALNLILTPGIVCSDA